ncbi:sugar ABC transporter permease [Lacrimispora sp.]|uniref:carbohydrate ABC transporter permease n=1 Tax=Lacrimispora sp. TaxID=2719234 RepID=UPI00142AADB0|nr:sugar ABC transporter permease [Hungatella sp.]
MSKDNSQIKKTKPLARKKTLVAYSFILPNLIGFLIFTFIPIVFSLLLSFCEWDSGNPIKFVGLKNFIVMFTKDSSFWIALKNTLYYTIVTVPVTMAFALFLAILMNKPLKGRVFFRSVLFFPYIASLVAVAVVWMALFNPDRGPVNSLLLAVGITNPPRWAASTTWAMPTIIGLTVWKGMGYYMIVYLAALQGVSAELYEAASLDGANKWKQFLHITWPSVTPTTFFILMMLMVSTFKSYDTMYITTQGGPGEATKVLAYHIYNSAFVSSKFGYASAVAMVLFGIIMVVTLIQFKGEKKFTSYL